MSEGAEVSVDKRGQRKKSVPKKGAEKKHSKVGGKDTSAVKVVSTAIEPAASSVPLNAEKAGEAGWQPGDPILTAEEIAALQGALSPTPEPTQPALRTEATHKQGVWEIGHGVFTAQDLAELGKLSEAESFVLGQYEAVVLMNLGDNPGRLRYWGIKTMKKFMDAGISGEVAALYMCQISENSNSDDVIAWAKHPELAIDILVQCPERFSADLVKFYAGHFQKHPEITWWCIPRYPKEFSPHDVANLVLAGIDFVNSSRHVELFSTQSSWTNLFNDEQIKELQQGKVPSEVKIAYNRYGTNWTDKAILYFAQHRAKPRLVASYPKEFSPENIVYCIESFVTSADIARYPEWTKEYGPRSAERVCFLSQHGADSKLARQVFERYEKKEYEKHNAWSELKKLVEAKTPLDRVSKYLEKYIIPAGYVADFIDGKVPPETVHDYISKIREVKYVFICECAAAGMTADSAKPYWEGGFEKPADAVALWKGKVSVDTAKPYRRFYGVEKFRYNDGSTHERQYSHDSSGAEIVRYIKDDVGPGVAALLRKADFTEEELTEAQRQFQKAGTRSKIFMVIGGIAVVAAAVGIGYKACGGSKAEKKKDDKPVAQATTQTTETTAKHGDDTSDEKHARERAERNGIPFMTQREAIASDKMVKNAEGDLVTKPGYKFIDTKGFNWDTEGLNWAIVPKDILVAPVSSSESLNAQCKYRFTPTPDGKGAVKPDCKNLDNAEVVIKGVHDGEDGRRIADGIITGIFGGDSYTCSDADFYMPEDRTQGQILDRVSASPTIRCERLKGK